MRFLQHHKGSDHKRETSKLEGRETDEAPPPQCSPRPDPGKGSKKHQANQSPGTLHRFYFGINTVILQPGIHQQRALHQESTFTAQERRAQESRRTPGRSPSLSCAPQRRPATLRPPRLGRATQKGAGPVSQTLLLGSQKLPRLGKRRLLLPTARSQGRWPPGDSPPSLAACITDRHESPLSGTIPSVFCHPGDPNHAVLATWGSSSSRDGDCAYCCRVGSSLDTVMSSKPGKLGGATALRPLNHPRGRQALKTFLCDCRAGGVGWMPRGKQKGLLGASGYGQSGPGKGQCPCWS